MVHTVGLIGANGNVGSPAAKALASSAKDGKIKLVILHRAGKPPRDLAADQDTIQLRVVDLEGPAPDIEAAVQGINVFISAIGVEGLGSEPKLVNALAKSKDLVTYIPAAYSTTWTEADHADPLLGGLLKKWHFSRDRAKETGLGMTKVYTGAFDSFMFGGFVGCDLKKNVVWANKKQLANGFPVSTMEHIAHVLNRIAIADPQSSKNTSHSVVTFWPTGQEVADLYSKINGKPAQVKDFTSKDRDELRADTKGYGLPQSGYRDHWENGDWEYESGGKVYDKTYSGPGIEEVARRYA